MTDQITFGTPTVELRPGDIITITFGTPTVGLRPGDIITITGVPLRGWRRFVAWLRRRPLTTGERRFVVRGTASETVAEVNLNWWPPKNTSPWGPEQ